MLKGSKEDLDKIFLERVDYSGRSVIVVDPILNYMSVAYPKMASELLNHFYMQD